MILNSVSILFLTQMPVILLLKLCTHRALMSKKEWKHFQECPKERLFNDTIKVEHVWFRICLKRTYLSLQQSYSVLMTI